MFRATVDHWNAECYTRRSTDCSRRKTYPRHGLGCAGGRGVAGSHHGRPWSVVYLAPTSTRVQVQARHTRAGGRRPWPRLIAVTLQHPTLFFDNSYGLNSANNGPYGDAIHQELAGTDWRRARGWGWPYFSQPICGDDRSLCSPAPSPLVPRQWAQSANSLGKWRARQDSNLRPSA